MTLRQEIENLIEEIKSSTKIKSENIQWDNGFDVCANSIKKDLTDILSRHSEPEQTAPFNPQDELKAIQEWIKDNPEQHEKILDEINAHLNIGPTACEMFDMMRCDHPEPTAPSQRERIATACMAGIVSNPNYKASTEKCAAAAVTAADALIEELKKPKKP